MTQAYNLSQLANNVNTSGQLNVATGVTGTQSVANGGTGQSTYTDGQLLIGNSTGNTLTKATITAGSGITVTNGSGAITIAASGGGSIQTEIFTTPGTWTKPASCTQVKVTVVGGGGGGSQPAGFPGSGGTGGSSSFGSIASATGGSGSGPNGQPQPGAPGSGTVSSGTALRTNAVNHLNAPANTAIPGFQDFVGSGRWYNGQSTSGQTYSTGLLGCAGASGGLLTNGFGGGGGVAVAIAPVSSPVPVTVGGGGPANNPNSVNMGGNGGIVVVEYVG